MSRRTCYWRQRLQKLGENVAETTQLILNCVKMQPAKAARIAATLHRRRT